MQRLFVNSSAMARSKRTKILAETPHLRLVSRGGWAYAQRPNASGIVAIVALTDDDRLLFVEQYRPPVDARVVEFPAGLAGDISVKEDESLANAARRELLEETGYRARWMKRALTGASSAGLTDETMTFFIAHGLRQVEDGGGDESEQIQVHSIARGTVDRWLRRKRNQGVLVDARVFAGLYFLQQDLARRK